MYDKILFTVHSAGTGRVVFAPLMTISWNVYPFLSWSYIHILQSQLLNYFNISRNRSSRFGNTLSNSVKTYLLLIHHQRGSSELFYCANILLYAVVSASLEYGQQFNHNWMNSCSSFRWKSEIQILFSRFNCQVIPRYVCQYFVIFCRNKFHSSFLETPCNVIFAHLFPMQPFSTPWRRRKWGWKS